MYGSAATGRRTAPESCNHVENFEVLAPQSARNRSKREQAAPRAVTYLLLVGSRWRPPRASKCVLLMFCARERVMSRGQTLRALFIGATAVAIPASAETPSPPGAVVYSINLKD